MNTTIHNATVAVEALDAVAPGQPFDDPARAAASGVSTMEAEAAAAIFKPGVEPIDPAVAAAVTFAIDDAPLGRFGAYLADLHAVATPDVAAFLRSALVIARVRSVAASQSTDEITSAAVEQYQRAVAAQLVDDPILGPAARIFAVEAPELQARIDAAVAAHRRHRETEIERIEREQREDAEVETRAAAAEREELAAFFKTRHGLTYTVSNRTLVATAIAALLLGNRAYDVFGEVVETVSFHEVRLLRRKTEAAEAVTA